tara:strand:+ start:252 stop:464 length:213 start_codon:yes stop_codon:yes gene_type:complete
MKLQINGEIKKLSTNSEAPSLQEIIEILDYNPKLIVVELNGVIIPPLEWRNKLIRENDIFEIVTIVGGGS